MKNSKKLPPNLTQSGNQPGCDEPMNRYEMNPVCPPDPCPPDPCPPEPCPPEPDCVKVYAVGPRGPQGPPGATGSPGPSGPQGIPGNTGPTGPQGPAGITGSSGAPGAPGRAGASVALLGAYNTLAELQAAHPTGSPGDAYLVNGTMYVWDAASSAWKLLGSLIGPQGVQGVQGVSGAAGAAGAVGPQGPPGSTGAAGPVGPQGPPGAQGPAGPQGPPGTPGAQGPQGVAGTAGAQGTAGANGRDGTGVNILGSYATLAALVAAHPTGIAGDAYLIGDNLYVWSTTSGTAAWTNVGTVRGPQGQRGAQGPAGTAGTQGSQGAKGDTGTQGPVGAQGQKGDPGPKGDTGAAGPRGLQGVPGPTGAIGTAGPQGVQGLQGAPGAPGSDGTSVTLKGSYNTFEDLEAAHPTGAAGDAYLVGGGLYIWDATANVWSYLGDFRGPAGAKGDTGPAGAPGAAGATGPAGPAGPSGAAGPQGPQGPQGLIGPPGPAGPQGQQGQQGSQGQQGPIGPAGPTGPQGPPGPAGPSGSGLTSLIPFASGRGPLVSANSSGAPSNVSAVGFGSSGNSIPISSAGAVTPTAESQIAFSLPFDAVIDSIYASFSNVTAFTVPAGVSAYPEIQLYTAAPGSMTFTPLAGTETLPAAGLSGQNPAFTTLSASRDNIGITLSAGTRILIGGQMELSGSPLQALSYYFFFSGAIAISQV